MIFIRGKISAVALSRTTLSRKPVAGAARIFRSTHLKCCYTGPGSLEGRLMKSDKPSFLSGGVLFSATTPPHSDSHMANRALILLNWNQTFFRLTQIPYWVQSVKLANQFEHHVLDILVTDFSLDYYTTGCRIRKTSFQCNLYTSVAMRKFVQFSNSPISNNLSQQ
jgi:hypothetical protein